MGFVASSPVMPNAPILSPHRERLSPHAAGQARDAREGGARAPLAAGLDVIAPVAEVEQALHLLERRFRELELVDVVLREATEAQPRRAVALACEEKV